MLLSNKLLPFSAAAALLLISADCLCQVKNTPAPIWSGEGNIPEVYRGRRVFLTPDEHNVIIVLPGQNGTDMTQLLRFRLRNAFYTDLHVELSDILMASCIAILSLANKDPRMR